MLGHIDTHIPKDEDNPSLRQAHPGMKYPHYSLDIPLFLVEGEPRLLSGGSGGGREASEAGQERSVSREFGGKQVAVSGCADVIRSLGSGI